MMTLGVNQILALAPDPASAAAGQTLARARNWQNLGRSDTALWGECQGSALYQVRVDLNGLVVKCSCPSRKFPCKHGLALMLIAASTPDRLPAGEPPGWVNDWLAQRARTAERRAETDTQKQARGAQ